MQKEHDPVTRTSGTMDMRADYIWFFARISSSASLPVCSGFRRSKVRLTQRPGFRAWGLGFRASSLHFGIIGLGSKVWGLGFGFRV
jgi:hypothetical protein